MPTAINCAIVAFELLLIRVSCGRERRRRHGAAEQHCGRHRQPSRAARLADVGHEARACNPGRGVGAVMPVAGAAMMPGRRYDVRQTSRYMPRDSPTLGGSGRESTLVCSLQRPAMQHWRSSRARTCNLYPYQTRHASTAKTHHLTPDLTGSAAEPGIASACARRVPARARLGWQQGLPEYAGRLGSGTHLSLISASAALYRPTGPCHARSLAVSRWRVATRRSSTASSARRSAAQHVSGDGRRRAWEGAEATCALRAMRSPACCKRRPGTADRCAAGCCISAAATRCIGGQQPRHEEEHRQHQRAASDAQRHMGAVRQQPAQGHGSTRRADVRLLRRHG